MFVQVDLGRPELDVQVDLNFDQNLRTGRPEFDVVAGRRKKVACRRKKVAGQRKKAVSTPKTD